jgi:penicillin-binding protein 2
VVGIGDSARDERSASTIRDLVCAAVVLAGFSIVILRLWTVQIAQGEDFAEKSRENFVQLKRIEHDRGEIVDREGKLLVANRPSLNVYLSPAFLPPAKRMIQQLGGVAGLSTDEARGLTVALARSAAEEGPPILLARDLGEPQIAAIRRIQDKLDLSPLAVPIIELEGEEEARYAAYLDPQYFPTDAKIYLRLRELLDLNPKEYTLLRRRASRARGLERYRELLIRHDLPPDLAEPLLHEIELGDLPGVAIRGAQTRDYRHGRMAAHLLGYVNELTPGELDQLRDQGYRLGDLIGRRGVERTFEEDLRGVDGVETVVVDSKGRPQESRFAQQLEGEFGEREPPKAGNRVVLAIDRDLQLAAERAFNGKAGAVVVLDVHTGELLTMTSTPSFDPNLVSGYFDPRERRRLKEIEEFRPWRFRAIQDHFAPGSTFKVVTTIAALSRKVTTESEGVGCSGAFRLGSTRFRCWKDSGHGRVDAVSAIQKSCDVWFYTMGNRMGLDPIASTAFDLGFGRKTGIALDGESEGIMPTEAWYNQRLAEGYTRGAAVNASIGQGAVTVTPIQLAVAYAAIANGGTVFEPQVALRIEAFDGSAVRVFPPHVIRKVEIPPDVLATVREGLRRVVNDPGGTAYAKRLKEMEVAGKTGTAQVAAMGKRIKSADLPYNLRDNAWFAAFAPASDPQIAIVVMNEHGGGGSSTAAPIAMEVARAWREKRVSRGELGAHEGERLELLAVGGGPAWPSE